MADPRALLSLAARVLPGGVGIGAADPHADFPAEPGGPPRATPARLREFAAGRRAARAAMESAGVPVRAVPMAADRAPVWPPGLAGSITHSKAACLAAVASLQHVNALGIDLEPDRPLPSDLAQLICLPEEVRWLDAQPADQRGPLSTLIFSAKEAAYKAQYPLTAQLLGFEDMQIDIEADRFTASFRRPAGPFVTGDRLQGRWTQGVGHFLTAVAMLVPDKAD